MRRISHNSQADVLIGRPVEPLVRHAQVVLNVSTAFVCRFQFGVKLTEDVLERFSADICKNIQATSETITHDNLCGEWVISGYKLKEISKN